MRLFYDLLPIIVFFIAYKFYNIYVATATAMVAAIVQIGTSLFRGQRPDMMQLVTLAMVVILGGATLLFRNELFIKWKPTVVYWVLGCIFLGSQLLSEKTLVQKMLDKSLSLPPKAWTKLNISWFSFFFFMGVLNLVIVYSFDTDTWVNFKLFGTLGLTVIFVVVQGVLVSRYLPEGNQEKNTP
ncbi:MAG: septation protein A [Gammaproteobacteria bacterium 39-13]|nr:septation protein A [Gammaproteobacteria bacterium]OJV94294.1 MAG: septation protein A [Gammaproteobacteria bacterium 39-13]